MQKKIGLLIALSLFFLQLFAQKVSFTERYSRLADSLSEAYGIPSSVILGISIIESSSGTSRNVRLLKNYFGIVGKNRLHKSHGIKTRYKQYSSDTASFVDFCRVVSRKKFYPTLKGNPNHKLWIHALSKSGYSEKPTVWEKLILSTIEKNKLAN
jgi:flagellum-specific peptidoglycan hydrolase FlgJ